MKKIIGILFFLWATTSLANVTGNWQGWGEWTYEGSGTSCNPMKLNFIETNDELIRTKGFFDCQFVTLEIPEATWKKEGSNLLMDGKIVGSFTQNSFHLTERYSETVNIELELILNGSHFDYHEIWTGKNNSPLYKINGRFFKLDN